MMEISALFAHTLRAEASQSSLVLAGSFQGGAKEQGQEP